jgi:hypothetical protein
MDTRMKFADDEIALLTAIGPSGVLACTMLGEARGDAADGSSVEERLAVGCVIRNRLYAKPERFATASDVCLAYMQFSCWLPSDPNRAALIGYAREIHVQAMQPITRETLALAELILLGDIIDRTGGATHFYAPRSMRPAGSMPEWTWADPKPGDTNKYRLMPSARIGSSLFYANIRW